VFLFLVGGFVEDLGNLDEAFLFRGGREIIVAHARLGLAGEGGEQVLFGAGAFDALHGGSPDGGLGATAL
jgi:hypothetical protein